MHREAPRDDGGLILQERTHLQITLLGAPNQIDLANDVYIAPDGGVERLRSQVRAAARLSRRLHSRPSRALRRR